MAALARTVLWQPQPGPQEALLRCPIREVCYGGARGGGKMLADDTPTLTPFGWKPHGELRPGDQLCATDGSVTQVIAVYPHGDQDVYRVTFSDGTVIKAGADHNWLGWWTNRSIKASGERRSGSRAAAKWTTQEIFDRQGRGARFAVPHHAPVCFARPRYNRHGDQRPLPPYLLGVLLGDGCLTGDSIRYSTTDQEIDDALSEYGVVRVDAGPNRRLVNARNVIAALKKMRLWGKGALTKRVPEAYLFATEAERWALLQGLMDTDGWAENGRAAYFCSASRGLVDDVVHLARSLGALCTITEKPNDHAGAWTARIKHEEPWRLFRLPRKQRAARTIRHQTMAKYVERVEIVGRAPMQCIEVRHPNSLYIVDGFTVTHNTDGMLGKWMAFREQYGPLAQGIFFRRRYKQLDRVRDRGKQLFVPTGAKFLSSQQEYRFVWPDGSSLRLRHLETTDDAEEYQGHEYNWQCFEEATQWPTPTAIDRMRATNRDSNNVPCYFLFTCNPGGPGHQWVKDRYITPNRHGYDPILLRVPTLSGNRFVEKEAVYIPAKVWDNRLLLASQPDYINDLYLSGPEWLVRAWLEGDWDIVAGGYLEGIWSPERHVIPPFNVPPSWPRFRAMDWGFAKPYSVGWYTTALDDFELPDGRTLAEGTMVRYRELYGYGGQPNLGSRESALDVKVRILEAERVERGDGIEFRRNPADRTIWNQHGTQRGIEELFRKGEVKTSTGLTSEAVKWVKGHNLPNTRIPNNQLVVAMLRHDMFAVTSDCHHFLRTVPVIPADDDNPEDIDTEAEDHAYDEFKMALASRRRTFKPPAAEQTEPTPFSGPWIEGIKNGRYVPPRPTTA